MSAAAAANPRHRARPVVAEPQPEAETASPEPDLARFFPGEDAHNERSRKPTAVVLFAPPGERGDDAAVSSLPRLRFVPIVCSLRGKLESGVRCGQAMPARAKVRVTATGPGLGLDELELVRSTAAYHDGQGSHVYPAPYGPACCMYETCVGNTIPYYVKERDPDSFLTTTKTVLAVWPADADVDLSVFAPGVSADVKVDDGPWTSAGAAAEQEQERLLQAVQTHERRYVSTARGNMQAAVMANLGHGWQRVLAEMGAREYYLLASTDLDGDKRPEILIYSRWANDYGFNLLANDAPKALYSFSCGNI